MESGFLHETKTILKSLVISCPNGMTVDRLNRDYRDTVGGWIPFKKLGYPSLEHFLKSLSDTLVLTGSGREARVGFVASDKTQHINDMVSSQKNTTRDRKVAVKVQPAKNYKNYMPPPPANQNKIHHQTSSNIYCTYNPNSFPINTTTLLPVYHPALNLNQLIGLQPLIQPHLQSTTFYGNQIYGNPNHTNWTTTPNINLNQRIEPPAHQKPTFSNISNQFHKNKKPPINNNNLVKQQSETKPVANELTKANNSRNVLFDPKRFIENNKQNQSDNLQANPTKSTSTDTKVKPHDEQITNAMKSVLLGIKNNQTDEKKSINEKNSKPESKIIFPTKSKPTENLVATKSTAFKNNNSVQQQRKNVLNKIENEKSSKSSNNFSSNSIVFPKTTTKFSNRKKLIEKITKTPSLPTVTESKSLIHPPVSVVDSDTEQENRSNEKLNTSKYLIDPFSQIDSSDYDIDEAVPEFAADYRVFHVDFPENTVPFGIKIPSVQFPKEFIKGAVVGVFIAEIHSPFKFWFHTHKENHELDVLMSGIDAFYNQLGEADLLIPRSCLTPGQVCVALYNDMWHRAEILTNVVRNKAKVLFVDYGTVSEVEIQHIKYLQNRFAQTPVQAIRGSLSHIKPVAPVWQKKAIEEFLSLVAEIFLYGQIVEIDEKEKTVYMVLCDTNNGQTLQINKVLVDRGFALLDSEWDEHKIKTNGYRKRHPKDIFPTFEMLETGEYPSLSELEQLLAQGIDYEKITEKIILDKFNNNISNADRMSFNLLDTNPFKNDIISEIISLKMFDK